jgi:DNA sulfur modification protein DndE
MKLPVEHVRVSARGKDILIKIKRRTGLEHWNEICRVAFCRSLANSNPPTLPCRITDNAIDMEWKTFAGAYSSELMSAILTKASLDGVDTNCKEALGDYFRAHLERGIASLQNLKTLGDLVRQM